MKRWTLKKFLAHADELVGKDAGYSHSNSLHPMQFVGPIKSITTEKKRGADVLVITLAWMAMRFLQSQVSGLGDWRLEKPAECRFEFPFSHLEIGEFPKDECRFFRLLEIHLEDLGPSGFHCLSIGPDNKNIPKPEPR